MTNSEALQSFNLLYNGIANNYSPGLDEYEISNFLNLAQSELIRSHYLSYESNETSRAFFRGLNRNKVFMFDINPSTEITVGEKGLSDIFPELFMIVAEFIYPTQGCYKNKPVPVLPVKVDELHHARKSPFRWNNKRAFRVEDNDGYKVYYEDPIYRYDIHYIKRVSPIVLVDLPTENPIVPEDSNLSIDSVRDKRSYDSYKIGVEDQFSEIDPTFHSTIIELAVKKALSVYVPHLVNPKNN